MATTTAARTAPAKQKARPLPPIKVRKMRAVGPLMEALVEANTDVFVAAGQRYRERHYAGTSRPLNPSEIASIAAGFDVSLTEAAKRVRDAKLKAHDEPDPTSVLLIAGVNTASLWIEGLLRVVALIEMPDERFRIAVAAGALDAALDEDTALLDDLDVTDVRERAAAVMDHLAATGGVDSGKAWGALVRSVWEPLLQAAEHLRTIPSTSSLSSSPPNSDGDQT